MHPSILDETRRFLRDNLLVLGLAVGAMLLAYGFGLTTYSLSIDEAVQSLNDRTGWWLTEGRPVVAAVKVILSDTIPLPFFDLALALAFLFVAAVAWAMLLVRASGHRQVNRAGLLAFMVVFTTVPINVFYLHFNTYNVEVSLGLVFAAMSSWLSWLWVMEERGPAFGTAAVAFAFLAVGTYQNLAFAAVAGVLVAQLAHMQSKPKPTGDRVTRGALGQTLRLAAPAAAALVLGATIHLFFVGRGSYTDGFVAWGSSDSAVIVQEIANHIREWVIGQAFPGGWVLIPTVIVTLSVLILCARRSWQQAWSFPLLLLLATLLTPFALSVALGSPLPTRAMQPLVLVAASMWLLASFLLPRSRSVIAALLAAALLLAVWNAGITTRYFLTEQLVYEKDRVIAHQLADRLVRRGWDGRTALPIVGVGRRPIGRSEGLVQAETFGNSFFFWDLGLRTTTFLRVLGYNLMYPTEEQWIAAHESALSMPPWPAAGSVVISDGVAIVKFAEPEEDMEFAEARRKFAEP